MPVHCGREMHKSAKAGSGKQRYACGRCGFRTTNEHYGEDAQQDGTGYDKELVAKHVKLAREFAKRKDARFVVTCAQNNTKINKAFLQTLERYCRHNGAMLLVVPAHYKNISLYTASKQYDKFWDKDIERYLVDAEVKLGGNVTLRADINIAVTTLNPLTGKEPIGGLSWTVFGHPQFAMEPVASPGDLLPKRMYTTGAITAPNYSKTNLGARAEFHHIIGAIVVEPVGKKSFVRHLNWDGAGFFDLDKYYAPENISTGQPAAALITGDEHVKFHLKKVRRATYDAPDSIVNVLHPSTIVRHDVLDGYAGSHHHEGDDVLQFRKHHSRDNDYRAELDQVVAFINETTPAGSGNCIVPSNHHDHLYKWLSRVDPRRDHVNALLIHELKAKQYTNALTGATVDPFEIYVSERVKVPVTFLDRSKPHLIHGINVSQHGDVGANGTRGNARALAKTTYKLFIGHAHGARIVRGVYQVGTSTGRLEYERGLSDHTNTHGLIYANGKRTLVDIFDGKWRK